MNTLSNFWAQANSFFWIGLCISFVFGYATNILSGPHSKRFREWIEGRYFRTLLRLGRDEVIVVLPHQPAQGTRRLPQVAVEDVLALRNVLEVLAELGINHPRIRHAENLVEPDLKRNIITIGGSNRNTFTREILTHPVNGDLLSFVQSSNGSNQVELKRGNDTTYTSPSYVGAPSDEPKAPSRDIAIILRRPNPKNESCSIVVLAGIRGIGTWGACDHLRKHAKSLAARVKKDHANAVEHGFLAVIDVDYENFDIIRSRVKDVTSIDEDA